MRVKFETLFAQLPEREFSVTGTPVQIADKIYYSGKKFGPVFEILGHRMVDLIGVELEVEVGPKDVQIIKTVYLPNERENK
jgi:hypothetical protein